MNDEHPDTGGGMTPGEEETPVDTGDSPADPFCPFCRSTEISHNEAYDDWSCTKCGRTFPSPGEITEEESTFARVKAPWELPHGAMTPERYSREESREYDARRVVEEASLLLLPRNMEIAFAWALKLAIILAGIFSVILGSHGLLVYFNAVEGLLPEGRDGAELFLATDVPGQLKGIVEWCSNRGLDSWTVPATLVAAGPVLWILQTYIQTMKFRLSPRVDPR